MKQTIIYKAESPDKNYEGSVIYTWHENKFYARVVRKKPVELVYNSDNFEDAYDAVNYLEEQFGITEEVKEA